MISPGVCSPARKPASKGVHHRTAARVDLLKVYDRLAFCDALQNTLRFAFGYGHLL